MRNIFIIVAVALLLVSCGSKSKIKKDLSNRYTSFDIIEIKPDSSNIKTAMMMCLGLSINISDANLKIVTALSDLESGVSKKSPMETLHYIDSVHNNIIDMGNKFENSVHFTRPDRCFYVKYTLPEGVKKVMKEEYYYINENNGDILHRPCEYKDFMYELKYYDLIQEALKYAKDIIDLKIKLKVY